MLRVESSRVQAYGFLGFKIGAQIIPIEFSGPLCYSYDKEPPKPYSNYQGPQIGALGLELLGLR